MPGIWEEPYRELKEYIQNNPEIQIETDCVAIPGEVRPEFYRRFDAVTRQFVTGSLSKELEKGNLLSQNWKKQSQTLTEELSLDSIELQPSTAWFLADPVDGLMRRLFNPLFDLIKGKVTIEIFEKKAVEQLTADFKSYYKEGYQRWATIALMGVFLPDGLWQVHGQDINNDANLNDGTGSSTGVLEGKVPDAVESPRLSFLQAPVNAFLAPNIIIRSKKLECFVSLRPDFHEPYWNASSLSEKQEWFKTEDIIREFGPHWLWPDMVLYSADDLQDLVLVADKTRIARPDVIVEFREEPRWIENEGLEKISRHHAILKPKSGTFVVSREAAVIGANSDPSIHIVDAGYDPAQLDPIIKAIMLERENRYPGGMT
jgi:hypothetical protein